MWKNESGLKITLSEEEIRIHLPSELGEDRGDKKKGSKKLFQVLRRGRKIPAGKSGGSWRREGKRRHRNLP